MTTQEAERPRPHLKLTGADGNAFAILGLAFAALHKAGATRDEIDAFRAEAMGGDYDHLLQTCIKYFEVT